MKISVPAEKEKRRKEKETSIFQAFFLIPFNEPERASVYDDHFSIVALSPYHFATHHHSVDYRNFLHAYDRTVLTTKPFNWAVKPWHYVHHTQDS
jgi:hypothetical protein